MCRNKKKREKKKGTHENSHGLTNRSMSGCVWWHNREKKPHHGTVLKKKDTNVWFDDDNLFRETAGKAGYVCTNCASLLCNFERAESGSRRVNETINSLLFPPSIKKNYRKYSSTAIGSINTVRYWHRIARQSAMLGRVKE
jgi:hypothetical protein